MICFEYKFRSVLFNKHEINSSLLKMYSLENKKGSDNVRKKKKNKD